MNSLKDISVRVSDAYIHVQSADDLRALSSGVVGGGFQKTRHILNLHVDKDYAGSNPALDLKKFARGINIREKFIGMMTAATISNTKPVFLTEHGLTVCAIVTVGLGNSTCAGITPPFLPNSAGTINTIIILDARLSRSAMVNAVITASEAKTAALQALNKQTKDGDPATGTSTDSVVIATTDRGELFKYAGSVSLPGWLIARAAREATYREIHFAGKAK
jgi:iron complex transport system ATP-binding protein